MRLALVLSSFPKLSETFMVSKFLGLLAKGWDVHVVCQQSDPTEWQHFPQLRAQPSLRHRIHVVYPHRSVIQAAWHYPTALLQAGNNRAYWQQGWRRFGPAVLKKFYLDAPLVALQPDLIHFGFAPLAKGRTYVKDWLGCKLSVSFRGYDLNYVGLETPDYYQEIWQHADGLHLLGQDLWRRAQRRGCPPDKLHALIPPAIDTTFFTPTQKSDKDERGPLRVLSIGRLTWVKGYEYALCAIKKVVDQGYHIQYRIVGDGPYLGPLSFLRHEFGLAESVFLLGAQPHEEVIQHLNWADVFLQASVSEGFGNAVLEAQAMQLPVVCSDAGGLPENVMDGQTGFVVPRRQPQALAEKLVCLAHDPDLRQRLGRAGRARAEKLFQIQDQIEAFAQYFDQVLQA